MKNKLQYLFFYSTDVFSKMFIQGRKVENLFFEQAILTMYFVRKQFWRLIFCVNIKKIKKERKKRFSKPNFQNQYLKYIYIYIYIYIKRKKKKKEKNYKRNLGKKKDFEKKVKKKFKKSEKKHPEEKLYAWATIIISWLLKHPVF